MSSFHPPLHPTPPHGFAITASRTPTPRDMRAVQSLVFPLSPAECTEHVRVALHEDQASNDVSTLATVVSNRRVRGAIVARRKRHALDLRTEDRRLRGQVGPDRYHRDDLVVILAGYGDRMETFFQSNPGMRSRIAHHLEFPDFAEDELLQIAGMMLEQQNYRFGPGAREVFQEYLAHRIRQPQFANARSVRNALDRARLRQASRLFANPDKELTVDDLIGGKQ